MSCKRPKTKAPISTKQRYKYQLTESLIGSNTTKQIRNATDQIPKEIRIPIKLEIPIEAPNSEVSVVLRHLDGINEVFLCFCLCLCLYVKVWLLLCYGDLTNCVMLYYVMICYVHLICKSFSVDHINHWTDRCDWIPR